MDCGGNKCISHFNLALETAKLRRKTGSPKVVVLLFSSRKKHLFLLEPCNMHASNDPSCLKEQSSWHSVSFSLNVRRLFHSISLHWWSGRIGSTFNNCDTSTTWSYIWIYRDVTAKPPTKKWTCDHVPFSQKPVGPQNYQQETTWFYMFLPQPNMDYNQSAISSKQSHMAHGQLWDRPRFWARPQISWKLLKQESLNATGWIIHQTCIRCISEYCFLDLLNCLLHIAEPLLTCVPFIDSEHSKHCQL